MTRSTKTTAPPEPEDAELVLDEPAAETKLEDEAAPPPKPGDKDYDWAAVYGDLGVYLHELPGGMFVGLPKFEFPNTTLLVELDDVPEMKQPRWMLMKALELSPAAADLVRSVKVPYGAKSDPIGDLIGKWIADATEGLTPGES